MEVKIMGKHRTALIRLDGEIDHHVVKKIRVEADRVVEKTGVINIAFDFSGVEFMDSSGVGMLIGRLKKVSALGGRVIVFGVSAGIRRILEMSGLMGRIVVADNLKNGLREAVR